MAQSAARVESTRWRGWGAWARRWQDRAAVRLHARRLPHLGGGRASPATRVVPAFRTRGLLQRRGRRIVPIHPTAPVRPGRAGLPDPRRRPLRPSTSWTSSVAREFAGEFADQAISVGARGVWFQLGRDRHRRLRAHAGGRRTDGDGHLPGHGVGRAVTPRQEPGRDLHIRSGPGVPHGLVIPASELMERFSRSSGPGGQSVNTTDSRVEISLDLCALAGAEHRAAGSGLTSRLGERLVVTASEHRSEHRNRVAARARLADRCATRSPRPRSHGCRPSRRRALSGVAWRASGGARR